MSSSKAVVVLAASILGLVACSKTDKQDASLPQQGASVNAAAVPMPSKASIGDGSTEIADFTVDPGQVFNCEGRDRATSKVKWSVKDPSVVTVKILVANGTSGKKKTFAAGANVGEAMTGNWVGPDARFFLVDGANDRELATYAVGTLPCT
ncbi:MAG TPA: hypothetical protein VLC71_12080 [Thermomonas sp.]|nr:hypothetical protein [Thermomonas sp.]